MRSRDEFVVFQDKTPTHRACETMGEIHVNFVRQNSPNLTEQNW